jgi:hypothetical protein
MGSSFRPLESATKRENRSSRIHRVSRSGIVFDSPKRCKSPHSLIQLVSGTSQWLLRFLIIGVACVGKLSPSFATYNRT